MPGGCEKPGGSPTAATAAAVDHTQTPGPSTAKPSDQLRRDAAAPAQLVGRLRADGDVEVADEPGPVGDARRGERDDLEVEVARRLRRSARVAADDEDADGVGLLLANPRDEPADEPVRQVRELYGSSPVRTSE